MSKSVLNLESTQEALTQLRSLREKRKKENPASIYDIVKTIYSHLKEPISSKVQPVETMSSGQYLGTSRESIEDMLAYIKDKVLGDYAQPTYQQPSSSVSKEQLKEKEEQLIEKEE